MEIKSFIKKYIPHFLLNFYYYLLPAIGAFLYGFPSKKIIVIGVTGTNGKSTVVALIAKILEEAGYKTASASSVSFKIGEKEKPNMLKMTMPGRMMLQKFLRDSVLAGCKYAVLEVTSEGIKQYRHKFIDFNVAVFTNLTPEHIESHGGFENYRKEKMKLFKITNGAHIINIDDDNAKFFLDFWAQKKYLYGLNEISDKRADVVIGSDIKISENGMEFKVNDVVFRLKMMGIFNIYNALAAICVGLSQGIGLDVSSMALRQVKNIPGRMEMVISNPFMVVVDYAFTPNALEKVYQTLKPREEDKKMICVLGSCGGGRDKWKRPILGGIAAKYCDKVIVTNEDPYEEDPMTIIEQVANGAEIAGSRSNEHKLVVLRILDRREAIEKALESAKKGDTVVITGKGSEPWMCIKNGRKIPWDDRRIVKEEFSKLTKKDFKSVTD